MTPVRTALLLLALTLLGGGAAGPTYAQRGDGTPRHVTRSGTVNEDLYLAGESVDVSAAVTGDVVAVGGTVNVSGSATGNVITAGGNLHVEPRVGQDLIAAGGNLDIGAETGANAIVAGGNLNVRQRVGGDLMAAGGNLELTGQVGDDVRAAGGTVSLSAAVGGDVLAAGGQVTLTQEAEVGGRAWLAGESINVNGNIGGELRVWARDARLNGTVKGDVRVEGEHLTIGPGARIGGRLRYASENEAEIDPAARIGGGVERLPAPAHMLRRGPGWGAVVLWGLVAFLALLTTATVLRYVFPGFSVHSAQRLAGHPWQSLGLGFALLLCIPGSAVLLFVTVIGVPLGLAVLSLYPLALGLGSFVAVVWLAEALGGLFFGARTAPLGWRVAVLWLAVLLLMAVGVVPWLGQLVQFAALLFGLGALGLELFARYRGAPAGLRRR